MHVLSNLPGISATDSRSYRIEALRVHLENQLGDQAFIEAYRHLVVSIQSKTFLSVMLIIDFFIKNLSSDDDQPTDELEQILGGKKMKFVTLITQLIVCEDAYYGT